MSPGLMILAPGLHTTVQDLGRSGYQDIGVPVSGALDGFSLRLANALVGNHQGMAALEVLATGPTLKVCADTVRVALAGPGSSLAVQEDAPRVVGAGQSILLSRDEVFQINLGSQSACCYLAVEGGIAVPLVLGSASTYTRAAFGGLRGRALQRDDFVPLALLRASDRADLRLPVPLPGSKDRPIRIILGPQHDYFTADAIATLLSAEFCVSKDADRMGMRLDGPLLLHRRGWDITSDAIATGAIQVPGSGQPIVLLADHQTTGGYPKIATVISTDIPVVAQRQSGDALRFVKIAVEEAEELCREEQRRFARLTASLEPVPQGGAIDLPTLYQDNLISGVVSGVGEQ